MVEPHILGHGMSDKIPFAVLAVHPNGGIEILTVLSHSHQQALATAASVCIQRNQPDLSIVAAFSLTEITNIQKILERAEFIGEGNGMQPDPVAITEHQLETEFEDVFEDAFDYFDEQNSQVEQRFPTRNRDLYDLDAHGTPQPKGTVAAVGVEKTTSKAKKPLTPPTSPKPAKKDSGGITAESVNPTPIASLDDTQSSSLDDLDLSQGKKTNDGKSNVFLDDYYQD